jgi:hypothetical protein
MLPASYRVCRSTKPCNWHLYADRGSPKFERAALRWLQRYLAEGSPTLTQFAEVTAGLAQKDS